MYISIYIYMYVNILQEVQGFVFWVRVQGIAVRVHKWSAFSD